jgi:hypothetical protein
VSVGNGGQLRLWDTSRVPPSPAVLGSLALEGRLQRVYLTEATQLGGVHGLAFYGATEGTHAVGYVHFSIDLKTGRFTKGEFTAGEAIAGDVLDFVTSPDLRWLVTARQDRSMLTRLRPDGSISQSAVLSANARVEYVTFDDAGRWVAFTLDGETSHGCDLRGGSAEIAVTTTRVLEGAGGGNVTFAFSPTEPLVVAGNKSIELRVLDLEKGGHARILRLPFGGAWGASFSGDGKWIAVSRSLVVMGESIFGTGAARVRPRRSQLVSGWNRLFGSVPIGCSVPGFPDVSISGRPTSQS